MKNILSLVVYFIVVVFGIIWLVNESSQDSIELLSNTSFLIRCGSASGSAVVFNRNGRTYVLTAQHVISPACSTRIVNNKIINYYNGLPITLSKFKYYHDEDAEYEVEYHLLPLKISDKLYECDIAILEVIDEDNKSKFKYSTKFPQFDYERNLKMGQQVQLYGCPDGKEGRCSYGLGTISSLCRRVDALYCYQIDSSLVIPGMSGSGVYNKNNEYIGMVVRKHDTINIILPFSCILKWAYENDMLWLFDDSLPENLNSLNVLNKNSIMHIDDFNQLVKGRKIE